MSNTLVVMCGVPGSGKSSLSARYRGLGYVVLSSDALRATIGANEGDQSVSKEVFKFIFIAAKYHLSQGTNVVIDATNYKRAARADYISIGKMFCANIVAHVVRVPIEVAKERNAKRARIVPNDVIDRMFGQWEEPTEAEGFSKVLVTENL
jgi:predicted kinase